jgi:hypothetical protein
VLTISELLQTARAVTPDGEVKNLTRQEQVDLDPAEHKAKVPRTVADRARYGPAVVTTTTTVDVPKAVVVLGEATVTFYLDPVDGSRWLADTVLDGRRVRTVVVLGGHQVVEEIAKARAAAGLPEPSRPGRPSSLRAFGGEPAQDTTTATKGGHR